MEILKQKPKSSTNKLKNKNLYFNTSSNKLSDVSRNKKIRIETNKKFYLYYL